MTTLDTAALVSIVTAFAGGTTSSAGAEDGTSTSPIVVLEQADIGLPSPDVVQAGLGRVGTEILLWGGIGADGLQTDRLLRLDLEADAPIWTRTDVAVPASIRRPVALTHPDGRVFSIGGSTAAGPSSQTWTIRHDEDGGLLHRPLPPLPVPLADATGALLGDEILIFGGRNDPSGPLSTNVWRLDPTSTEGWRSASPLPGPGRSLAIGGSHRGSVYCIGGLDRDGLPLHDVWRYDPIADDWHACEPIPRSTIEPCGSLVGVGWDMLAVIDRGPDLLVYHPITDRWSRRAVPDRGPPGPQIGRGVARISDTGTRFDGETIVALYSTPVLLGLKDNPSRLAILDWVAIAIYGAILLGLGVFCARGERSTDDFFLAGRRIPWWASGISIFATSVSAITFMATPAKSWDTDWTYFLQSLGAVVVAPFAAILLVPAFRKIDVVTAYEYLEHRFHWSLRLAASALYMLFQVGRVAIVTLLPALALAAVTGLDVVWCIMIMGMICIAYTVLGGIEAVIWSDVLQVAVLFGGAIWALVVMIQGTNGGLTGLYTDAADAGKLRLADLSLDLTRPSILVILMGAFFTNLIPYASDQSIVQRYLAVKDERDAKRAVLGGAVLSIPASLLFFGLGTGLWSFYRSNPDELQPTGQLDQILPLFVVDMLPSGVAGIVLAGLFAAAMSSLDSAMNSVSTAFTTDWYQRFRPTADDRHRLRVARIATVGIGVIGTGAALVMVRLDDPSLLDVWFKVIGLFGSGVAGVFLLGVLTRRTGPIAGWSGLIAGTATVWSIGAFTQISGLAFAAFGIVACLGTGLLVGLVDRRSSR